MQPNEMKWSNLNKPADYDVKEQWLTNPLDSRFFSNSSVRHI